MVTGGMAQSWWTGWIARKIEGTWVPFLEGSCYARKLTSSLAAILRSRLVSSSSVSSTSLLVISRGNLPVDKPFI